jgi:SAM-dependent methyltransferase
VTTANREQADHWNGLEAAHWVTGQVAYDRMLEPLTKLLLDAARLEQGDDVLDVGCGCGATSRAAADLVDPGRVMGIDLSVPMLERGQELAADRKNLFFEVADAQVKAFAGDFDAVISRLGVMFFSDPVAGFTNLRLAAKAGGRLSFVCWQPLTANEWLMVSAEAFSQHVAVPQIGGPPGGPGMFALADAQRTTEMLSSSGWKEIQVEPHQVEILLGGAETLEGAVEYVRAGSLGRTVLTGLDPAIQERALDSLRDALAAHLSSGGVRLGAAVWVVSAAA